MVLPITGKPNVVLVNDLSPGYSSRYERRITGAVQKAPFNLPTSYYKLGGTWSQSFPNTGGPAYWSSPPFGASTVSEQFMDTNLLALCANQAYDRFKSKIYTQAALGVDFAEAHQSYSMIVSTCGTLLKVARSIRKLDFLSAARALRMKFIPKGVSKRKSFANNWLEYHFGWEPLVHDIYDSVDVINNPLKSFTIERGSCSIRDKFNVHTGAASFCDYTVIRNHTFAQGGRVNAIHNSTVHTLESFGLINPLSIAWELVPFSFVVDWFANVGQVLASVSDFAGMTLVDTWSSRIYRVGIAGQTGATPALQQANPNIFPMVFRGGGYSMQRGVGLTLPSFAVKQLRLPSKVRSATAISLLIQQLVK